MNGQQLTNSSNSANGTPSSSYPASLSSQSSRDPSPATRPGAPRKPFTESYNHVISPQPNHWPKDKSNALLSGLVDSRPSPQFAPAAASSPTPPPPSTLPHQPNPESRGLQASGAQPVGPSANLSNFPPSQPNTMAFPSQPMYRFPPPTSLPQNPPSSVGQPTSSISLTNHNSQPGSLSNQFPARPPVRPTFSSMQSTQSFDSSRSTPSQSQQPHQSIQSTQPPPNPLRSTQSPLQQPQPPLKSSVLPEQPKSIQSPLQQPPSSMQSTQLPPNPPRSTQSPLQQQYPPMKSSQLPEPTASTQNLLQQQPLQSTQPLEPPKSTQSQQPSSQFQSRPPFQASTGNQFLPNSNQFQKPFPIQNNQFNKLPTGQAPQSLNQFSQPPGQSSQLPPQFPQLPNKSSQPLNQTSQLPNQNQYQQPQHQFGQPSNQFFNPPPQISQPTSQFSQPPSQSSLPPNHISHSSGQFPLQTPGQPPLPPVQYNTSGALPQQQFQSAGYSQPPSQSQQPPNQFNKRYPQMPQQPGYQQQFGTVDGLTPHMAGLSVNQGFNKLWGMDTVDLLKSRDLLPKEKMEPPPVRLQHELYEAANCSPEIFRCTLTKIPETKSLLDKSRLPLGVLIHPFKDLNERTAGMEEASGLEHWPQQKIHKQLSVIQCTVIVRCRVCRTYINPFVYFVDNKRWKCNLCFRVNELPDEFQFDPMTKTYGDPSRRPEIKSATIEFIAPSEYMVRPPQPAIYVFVLDVSRLACESGYLDAVCRTLLAELDNVPGDARTCIAFITFDSSVHFYSLTEGQGQPHQMIVVDIEDMFLPTPDNLLVSLNECRDLIRDLLHELPNKYRESYDTHSALGAALQAAYKLLAPTGGRVTVFQACLPNVGPGALSVREDPSQRAGENPPHLNPATDFYKKLALDCSGQQIAVDLFLVNSQYLDLATISGVSRFSGGCMHHIPLYRSDKPLLVDSLERMFQRYLTRKIGFESVMRLRCTRGLSIHTFHGNFFVRSTDLLSLPNANPDAGFGMQVTIDESLAEVQNVCFQAALLYTSSKGERRIRVHTLCLPVASNLADIMHGADQQCIVGLLSKMAVDRAIQSSLSDAREAFVNVVADVLSAYKLTQSGSTAGCMLAPASLRLLPLYILALLKNMAFRVGQSTRLDDRVFAMCQMKSLPLAFLMQSVYPDLYALLHIEQQPEIEVGDETVPQPPRLQLSAERVDSFGLYLLDDGISLILYVGHNLDSSTCQAVFNVPLFSAIPQDLFLLPELDNPTSKALRNFVTHLQNEKPYPTPLQVLRDDSPHRTRFLERLIEDKNESGTSYYEFLQRIKTLMK